MRRFSFHRLMFASAAVVLSAAAAFLLDLFAAAMLGPVLLTAVATACGVLPVMLVTGDEKKNAMMISPGASARKSIT